MSGEHSVPSAAEGRALRARRWRALLTPLAVLAVFVLAAVAVHRVLHEFSYAELRAAVAALTGAQILAASAATAASYFLLTGYDWSALRYLGRTVPYPTVACAAFCGYAISNTVGLSFVSGGSVRYRLYLERGLDGGDVARLTAFSVIAFGLGVSAVGAVSILAHPAEVAAITGLPTLALRGLSGGLCFALGACLVWCVLHRGPVVLGAWRLRLPSARLALRQFAISVLDLAAAGTVLFALLPAHAMPFAAFLGVYATATVAGVASHVPGGLGVFELVVLLALRDHAPAAPISAALVAYRVIYYLVPFVSATVLLAAREVTPALGRLAANARGAARVGASFAPLSLGLLAFASGVMLLWSAATPALPARFAALSAVVPLFVVEFSHLMAAAIGGALLVIAHGLRNKLNGAWIMALTLSILGGISALAKGIDYEESLLLMLLACLLWATRAQFYRRTALLDSRLSPGWLVAVMGVLAGSWVLVAFSFKHVEYAHALWWQFELQGEASRALRGSVAGATALIIVGVWRLLRPPSTTTIPPDAADLARAEAIVRGQPRSEALLALMGDKSLLFDAGQRAFIMYGVRGNSWIALGDPVGDPPLAAELAWQFRERADAAGARVAFYQACPAMLPLYLDMGLTPLKLGVEAIVPLSRFTLDGPRHKTLRQTVSRAERDGLRFRLHAASEVPALIPELRAVSADWLESRRTREKRFSLGCFDPAYLARAPIATVRLGDRVVAFASLLMTDLRAEASIDLMRHRRDAPGATMQFLLVQLILHYKAEGYARFQLGMAPLSGLERHPLAPLWHRFGNLLYSRGERFYNFRGLRQFKERFDPDWEPRYLVSQAGVNPLLVMLDVAALIAGGMGGTFRK